MDIVVLNFVSLFDSSVGGQVQSQVAQLTAVQVFETDCQGLQDKRSEIEP